MKNNLNNVTHKDNCTEESYHLLYTGIPPNWDQIHMFLNQNKFVNYKNMNGYISPNQEVYLYINTIYKLEALMYGNACLLRCLDIKQGNYTCMISNVYFLCLQEVSLLHINLMTFLVNINYNIVCDITNITRKCYIEGGITNIRKKTLHKV